MTASTQADGVRAIAEPVARRAGLVLEDVTVSPAGRRRVLRITVDLPEDRTGGVPLDAVADVSQALSQALDDGDVMGGTPYVLEVSSPGVDRPLTERRHWARNRGRRVTATLADGTTLDGRITEAGDDGLVLDSRPPLPWDRVVRGAVQVEFNRPGEDPEALPDDDDLEELEADDGPDETGAV